MRALIDTNILIHRETKTPTIYDIGTLFYWLDKLGYRICIHPITKEEINKNKNLKAVEAFSIKMHSYEVLGTPRTIHAEVEKICKKIDVSLNDVNDTRLLDEVYCDRVDLLITEDKKIYSKAKLLKIEDKVFTVKDFLNYVKDSTPGLIDYDVLPIKKQFFSELNLDDPFFNSLKKDYTNEYTNFSKWFSRKLNEEAYTLADDKGNLEAFLYLKVEYKNENYFDISPSFKPKKRLKIGTLKVSKVGMRVGERFLKIIFDNAKLNNVEEIYVTVFKNTDEQNRLIAMLEDWGFLYHGVKKDEELVYYRKFTKTDNTPVNRAQPKKTYPFIS